jgi:serine/threonine protein kinase
MLEKTNDFNSIKLLDFGFARLFDSSMQDKLGTPYYIAPEILAGLPYDFKCDIWSLGVLSY